uniref:Uncharacterized protein n=1 Tax=uncultured bacterium A1Q1_fos_493 TaxID=1256577 RepID=L7VZE1_9BACT|nr:hypothetical protein [uncultured bacterium A1Q1_fos_493]
MKADRLSQRVEEIKDLKTDLRQIVLGMKEYRCFLAFRGKGFNTNKVGMTNQLLPPLTLDYLPRPCPS